MSTWLRWSALLVFVMLIAVPSASAASQSVLPSENVQLTAATSAPTLLADASATQLQPIHLTSAPSYTVLTPTLLAPGTQSLGFQGYGRKNATSSHHVQWAIAGAAVGVIWGLIDDDPVQKGLIGAAVGLGLSFVMHY